MHLDDVISELNVALSECRKEMLKCGDDKQTMERLRDAAGKIELAIELLKAARQA